MAMQANLEGVIVSGKKGRYRILNELSQGAQAKVFEAMDLERNKHVAIKILSGDDYASYERMEREAKIFEKLRLPHIMYMRDSGTYEDRGVVRFFCVFPLIPGGITLEDVIVKEGSIRPLPRALDLLSQIAEGLKGAHSCGIVHRDIKPGNILLHRDGTIETAFITDFGIAAADERMLEKFERNLTMDAHILGTPDYAAPEQLVGASKDAESEKKRKSSKVDVYAFGVTACEMLTGRTPFTSFQGNDALKFICEKRDGRLAPDSVGKLGVDLPEELVQLVDSCLRTDSSERPDLSEVLSALSVIRLELPVASPEPFPTSRRLRTPGSTNVSVDAETMCAPSTPPEPRKSLDVKIIPSDPVITVRPQKAATEPAPVPEKRRGNGSLIVALGILTLAAIGILVLTLTQSLSHKPVLMEAPSASVAPMPVQAPPVASSAPAPRVVDKPTSQPSASAKPKTKARGYTAPPPVDWAPPSGMPIDPSMPVPPM